MNYTCCKPWVPWFPYVAATAGSYMLGGVGDPVWQKSGKVGGNFHCIFKIAPLEHRTPESDTADLVAEI